MQIIRNAKQLQFDYILLLYYLGYLFLYLINTFFSGLSGKAQILYALVFTTKFLDLPNDFVTSLPSFVLKVAYLFITYLTVVSIYFIGKRTYDREHDVFR